jgi:excisionase family DNA binding protein
MADESQQTTDEAIAPAVSALPLVLTVDEAAVLVRCDRKTLYRAVRLGEIPAARRLGGVIRIHRDSFLAWLAGGATLGATGHGRLTGERGRSP